MKKTILQMLRVVVMMPVLLALGACYDINYFYASPDVIISGQPTNLIWDADDYINCVINNSVGPVPATGVLTVAPVATTSYALYCSDSEEADFAQTLVLVLPSAAPWTEESPMASPGARIGHAMAFDGEKIILFGGDDGALQNDTWSWDGATWVSESPMTSPPARAGHAMARTSGGVLLFGGEDGSGPLNDTWLWDGDDWTQLSPDNVPPARAAHAMARDGGSVVLFGGEGSGGLLGDTWRWDGNNWNALPGPSPSARADAQLSYDVQSGDLQLLGGRTASAVLGDRWTLTPLGWRLSSIVPTIRLADAAVASDGIQVLLVGGDYGQGLSDATLLGASGTYRAIPDTIAAPGARQGAAAAYDSVLDELVLFGGDSGTMALGDTWTWVP